MLGVLFSVAVALWTWVFDDGEGGWRIPILEPEPSPVPLRLAPPEPDFDFDPSAFWLFPDWDSGPIKEPFWMRPLKKPASAPRCFTNETSALPMVWGTHRLMPMPTESLLVGKMKLVALMHLDDERTALELRDASGKHHSRMVTRQEADALRLRLQWVSTYRNG